MTKYCEDCDFFYKRKGYKVDVTLCTHESSCFMSENLVEKEVLWLSCASMREGKCGKEAKLFKPTLTYKFLKAAGLK